MVKILGTDDSVNTCECCGKTNLKHTVVVEVNGEVMHYGSVCATRHTGMKSGEITTALRDAYAEKVAAAKREYNNHPDRLAYEVKIMQANRDGIPAGRAFREYLGDTVSADRAARVSINAKYGVLLA